MSSKTPLPLKPVSSKSFFHSSIDLSPRTSAQCLGRVALKRRFSHSSSFFICEILLIWLMRCFAKAAKPSVKSRLTTFLDISVTASKLLHGYLHLTALSRNFCLLWYMLTRFPAFTCRTRSLSPVGVRFSKSLYSLDGSTSSGIVWTHLYSEIKGRHDLCCLCVDAICEALADTTSCGGSLKNFAKIADNRSHKRSGYSASELASKVHLCPSHVVPYGACTWF